MVCSIILLSVAECYDFEIIYKHPFDYARIFFLNTRFIIYKYFSD
jgi:hypothetical protein